MLAVTMMVLSSPGNMRSHEALQPAHIDSASGVDANVSVFRPEAQASVAALDPSPAPEHGAEDGESQFTFIEDPNYQSFSDIYTSYLCVADQKGVHATEACRPGAEAEHDANEREMRLRKQIQRIPAESHLIVYGSSYVREIADSIRRIAYNDAPKHKRKVTIHAENDDTKPCFCGLHETRCPCADYATYDLPGKRSLTIVANYEKLQSKKHVSQLHHLLKNGIQGKKFTHALVMEPHTECFFKTKHVDASHAKCNMNENNVYGCGWSESLWEVFGEAFGHGKLLHIVPWGVSSGYSVASHGIVMRSRPIVKPHMCEAKLDPNHPTNRPATALVAMGDEHQCFAICDKSFMKCHTGSPTLVASEALEKLHHI